MSSIKFVGTITDYYHRGFDLLIGKPEKICNCEKHELIRVDEGKAFYVCDLKDSELYRRTVEEYQQIKKDEAAKKEIDKHGAEKRLLKYLTDSTLDEEPVDENFRVIDEFEPGAVAHVLWANVPVDIKRKLINKVADETSISEADWLKNFLMKIFQ